MKAQTVTLFDKGFPKDDFTSYSYSTKENIGKFTYQSQTAENNQEQDDKLKIFIFHKSLCIKPDIMPKSSWWGFQVTSIATVARITT